MKRCLVLSRQCLGAFALAAVAWAVGGCSGSGFVGQGDQPTRNTVIGATQVVSGSRVVSWARIDQANNRIESVGVTVPFALIQNPPPPGSGPLGAFATLPFPASVRSSTFLDHVEIHWNPQGHEPEFRYGVPHFDIHFYNMTVEEVRAITPPDPAPPAADRIPPGYFYPGPNAAVPQMGTHAVPLAEFAPGAPPFSTTMILGYYNGRMIFVEPMVTQELLLNRQDFTLTIPAPAVLGRATLYPTRFQATYNAAINAYEFVLSDFVSITQ